MAKLLGIDVGTSGCKVLLIDETGSILKQAHAEYPIYSPHNLWSEQDPADWLAGVLSCLEEVGERKPDAIGLTGQMHGAVFLDGENELIRPAILWNDQRTVAECREIDETVGAERVRAITCNPPLTGFQAPKILWLRNHEPDNYNRLAKVLLPKDYIRLKLTGAFFTEVSDASGTGLLDVPNRRWSPEMMEKLRLNPELLAECAESDVASAYTDGKLYFDAGVPVVGGGGDQAAAAVGTGAVVPGVISVSLGTSGVVFTSIPSAKYDQAGATHTFCHANRGWHAMGVMLSCGGALRWFRDVVARGLSYNDLAALASDVEPGAGGVTFMPYLTGERCPYIDPYAKAGFNGLAIGHTLNHMSRAVFEGASIGLFEAMNLLKKLGASSSEIRVNGGGAKSDFWVQMLADMFKANCVTLEVDEGPAFGAAILAGVASGIWSDVASAAEQVVKVRKSYSPTSVDYTEAVERAKLLYDATKSWNPGS